MIMFQITMVFLIINYMIDPVNGFQIIAAKSFYIVIPRFLSSMMMHLQVEADIKDGLQLMKWAVNNPDKFKSSQ